MLRDDVLTASLSDSAGSVALSSRIESVSREPSVEAELVLSEVRAASLPASPGARAPDVELTGTLSAEGPIEGFSVGGSLVVEGEDGRASVSVDGIVGLADGAGSVSLDVRSPDAVLRGVELPFSSTLRVYGDRVAIQSLEVDGLGEARLALSRRSDRSLSGSVVVSEARLQDVLAAFADVRAPQSLDGLVFASLSLAGSRDAPRIEGQVQIGNGSVMGVDGLSAVLAGRLEDGIIHVDEMALQHDGDRVLNVEGTADLDGDVAIIARGSGIPGPLLMGDDGTRFSLRLGVGGDRRSPTLDAVVEASDGAFLGVPFDDFLARVTGAENVLRLNPLSLEKRGAYRARAEGTVPWSALSGETASDEATMTVEVDGDPLALLAGLTSAVESGRGSGTMQVVLAGSRGDVSVAAASLEVSDGTIVPAGVIERVDDVEIEVRVADGRLTRGVVSGTVGGERIALERAVLPSPQPEGLESLSVAGIDVGILALSTGEDGVRASVPGLMLPEDIGRIVVRGEDGVPALLIGGPSERPSLRGELVFSDVSFTYPLLESEEGVGGFLASADWALRMTAGRNLWYWRPDANLQIVRGSTLEFRGVPDEGSLCVSGRVESQRGSVTYANTDFDVREASVDFPYFCGPPRFYVLAETRVDDGTTISLTMDSYEEAFAAAPGATFDESELRLSSDSPDDDSREDILSKLQYGMSYELLESEEQESLERRRALEVVGSQLSGRIVRPLLSPVEGRIKRALDLDLVRFEIDFVQHFLAQLDLWQAQEAGAGYQPFLTDTRITLGKYISRKWMFSYVGRADAYEEELGDERLGFSQELGIEYEVSRNTSLSLRVVYDPALAGWDRRVTIENRFRF